MVNYHFKNELIRSGFKTYLSAVKNCDYNFLPDEIIEKIMKYVNENNILIISSANIILASSTPCNRRETRRKYSTDNCKYCHSEVSHTKATPCPIII
mgnify:CR=1 FL=1